MSKKIKQPDADWIVLAMAFFEFSAFALLAFRQEFDMVALALAVVMPLLLTAQVMLLGRAFPHMDRYILMIGNFLCGIGLIMLYRLSPDKALKQLLFYAVGIVVMLVVILLIVHYRHWHKWRYPVMVVAWGMLALTLVVGKETYGAKNWIDFGFFSLQSSEFVKVALIFLLAQDLSERRTIRSLLPVGIFAAGCVGLIVMQKDLGAVLICFIVCIAMYYIATSNWALALSGLGVAAAGSMLLYTIFPHVQTRVAIWKNPWATPDTGGYQIIQSLIAIASGGMTGMGLGQGSPTVIPVYDTDFIFAALCEEFGIVIGLCVLAMYLILFVRSFLQASRARSSFHALLSVGAATCMGVQTFMIVGGVIKMIPLTGVTLPYISYGGSSLISCMILLAILLGVSIVAGQEQETAWRRARALEEMQS